MPGLGRFSNYFPPTPLFGRSPRPEQDLEARIEGSPASTFSSRFGGLHFNVRSMVNGSSVYSQSAAPLHTNTPKIPFLGFRRRPQSPPDPILIPGRNDAPRDSNDSRSPLQPLHTAGSYMRTIAPLQDPREPEMIYNRHPADVPLAHNGSVDPETEQLQEEVQRRRRRRRRRHHHHGHGHSNSHGQHRRRKHHRQEQWVRRKSDRGACIPFAKSPAARGKCIALAISGLFLMTVLAIYLAIALSRNSLGQEIHVLFIMIILATTIFFCHSLIRLCMIALHPPTDDRPRIPSMTGPEGFRPIRPIQVHLARDEELGDQDPTDEGEDSTSDPEKEKKIAPPPPAYGLWRSSVRVDPNLLHWQRVEPVGGASPIPPRRFSSVDSTAPALGPAEPAPEGPRPPSYISEDGISYVVEAAPRSTAPAPSHSGVSDIHPAWRPGYTVEPVQIGEWPAPRRL